LFPRSLMLVCVLAVLLSIGFNERAVGQTPSANGIHYPLTAANGRLASLLNSIQRSGSHFLSALNADETNPSRVYTIENTPSDFFYTDPSIIENRDWDVPLTWPAEKPTVDASDCRLNFVLGNQPVSVGLTNERVAGLDLKTNIDDAWSVTALGGLPTTPAPEKGVVDNLVYGGRIEAHPRPWYKIGLSMMLDNGQETAAETATDFNFNIGSMLAVNGLARTKAHEWREHRYSVGLHYESFRLAPVYESFYAQDEADRFTTKTHLFGFLTNADPVRIAGTDIGWEGAEGVDIALRTRRYDYSSWREAARYYAGLISIKAPAESLIDLEIGRMEGHLPETQYMLVDADLVCQHPMGLQDAFFNVDARYIDYDQRVRGRDMAFHTSWGVGYNFFDGHLKAKLAGVYKMDPYVADDVTAMLSIQFNP
jgi:hypothetical protein